MRGNPPCPNAAGVAAGWCRLLGQTRHNVGLQVSRLQHILPLGTWTTACQDGRAQGESLQERPLLLLPLAVLKSTRGCMRNPAAAMTPRAAILPEAVCCVVDAATHTNALFLF
jgi:hypothetical protein